MKRKVIVTLMIFLPFKQVTHLCVFNMNSCVNNISAIDGVLSNKCKDCRMQLQFILYGGKVNFNENGTVVQFNWPLVTGVRMLC